MLLVFLSTPLLIVVVIVAWLGIHGELKHVRCTRHLDWRTSHAYLIICCLLFYLLTVLTTFINATVSLRTLSTKWFLLINGTLDPIAKCFMYISYFIGYHLAWRHRYISTYSKTTEFKCQIFGIAVSQVFQIGLASMFLIFHDLNDEIHFQRFMLGMILCYFIDCILNILLFTSFIQAERRFLQLLSKIHHRYVFYIYNII